MNSKSINMITSVAKINKPLELVSGKIISEYDLKYETYGTVSYTHLTLPTKA